MSKKYSNFLTIILVLVIIAIIGIIAFLGYKYYQTYVTKSSSEDFVGSFVEDSENNESTSTENGNTNIGDEGMFDGIEEGANNGNSSSSTVKKYNGFVVAGTIEIPKTQLKSPIIAKSEYSTNALETAVVELYGDGLNQVGNTTIAGHNRKNGIFFSNNKKLNIGDKIYITDLTGKRLCYTIYDKFETDINDSEYMIRDTQGAIEITLYSCTDDNNDTRLVILAKANV